MGEKNGFSVFGVSRQQQDRGSLVETEAKTKAGGVETETEAGGVETEAVKILSRGTTSLGLILQHCRAHTGARHYSRRA